MSYELGYKLGYNADVINTKLGLIKPVDESYDSYSTNAQSGIAVAEALAALRVNTDQLVNDAVTGEKIKSNTIELEHLSENLVNKLSSNCWEYSTLSVSDYDDIDDYIFIGDNNVNAVIFRVVFKSSFPQYDLTGESEYLCIKQRKREKSNMATFLSLETGSILTYTKDSENLEKVSPDNTGAISAHMEYLTFDEASQVLAYSYEPNVLYAFKFSGSAAYGIGSNHCIGCYSSISKKLHLFDYEFNKCKYLDFNESTPKIHTIEIAEQKYDPESSKPQSGKAVAEAVAQILDDVQSSEAIEEALTPVYGIIENKWDSYQETILTYDDLDSIVDKYNGNNSLVNVLILDESDVSNKGNFLAIVDNVINNNIVLINKATGELWSYKKGSNKFELVNQKISDEINSFINLGEIYDIRRLDLALLQNNYDKSKVYRFSFKDDIAIQDFVIPGKTEYIGYIGDKENYGRTIVFESLISDGIKRVIGLESVEYHDYWEELQTTAEQKYNPKSSKPQSGIAVAEALKDYGGDFTYIGTFTYMHELKTYPFKRNKLYAFSLTGELNEMIGKPAGGLSSLMLGSFSIQGPTNNPFKLLRITPIDSYGGYLINITDGTINPLTGIDYSAFIETFIDQTFDPDSENAQSGKAVAEAFKNTIIPDENLEESYWKHVDIYEISDYNTLNSLISDYDKPVIYKLRFRHEFPKYSLLGSEKYLGIPMVKDYEVGLRLISLVDDSQYTYFTGGRLDKINTDKMNTADKFYRVNSLRDDADPEIIAYQTQDVTTNSMLRIPLSMIKETTNILTDRTTNKKYKIYVDNGQLLLEEAT